MLQQLVAVFFALTCCTVIPLVVLGAALTAVGAISPMESKSATAIGTIEDRIPSLNRNFRNGAEWQWEVRCESGLRLGDCLRLVVVGDNGCFGRSLDHPSEEHHDKCNPTENLK